MKMTLTSYQRKVGVVKTLTSEESAALQRLIEGVNGFVYHGDRLNAILETVSWLKEHPGTLRALFPEAFIGEE